MGFSHRESTYSAIKKHPHPPIMDVGRQVPVHLPRVPCVVPSCLIIILQCGFRCFLWRPEASAKYIRNITTRVIGTTGLLAALALAESSLSHSASSSASTELASAAPPAGDCGNGLAEETIMRYTSQKKPTRSLKTVRNLSGIMVWFTTSHAGQIRSPALTAFQ